MSRHHIEKVTCPSCHHEGDFELWASINTALDPEMKEKVLNKSIFLYTCPSCGETFRLNYPTLYHQMEDLIMIYLVSESEVEKTYEMFYGAVDIDNMYEFASSHCNDFKDLRDDDEIVINREWILNKLAEAENE